MYAEVLIEYNVKQIDKTFTYIIPKTLKEKIKVGMKVIVPFGRKNVHGFVLRLINNYEGNFELKEIKEIENENFVLNDELMLMGSYLQKQTLCTRILAYQTMLPSSLKVKDQKTNYNKYLTYIKLNPQKDIDSYIINNPRRTKDIEILNALKEKNKILKKDFPSININRLLENDLIILEEVQTYRIKAKKTSLDLNELTNDQKNAINQIELDKENVYLLHGVTASGKTRVYIELIKKVIKEGKTAILLVPEISLTTQVINRFYENFGEDVAIFHSALSNGEKYDEYLKIYRKEVHIVIGTRSAIFTPLENLGIIIIDEEHSETYKQDTNPRYNAIDMAKFRSKYNNIPIILGSATPSLETMARAKKGVYKYISMPNRVGNFNLPNIKLVDKSKEKKNSIISHELETKIRERLDHKEQILILLNKRGFSKVTTCKTCGYTYKCPHCDIALTYHLENNTLRCHYCGYTIYKPTKCPNCKEATLTSYGLGTEQLENALQNLYKDARIIRMDRDTTTKKGSHEKIITDFKNHEYDILIGTQMISKGLDFPLVTLVGVLNADDSLNVPDFRSGEKTFALLSQTSGRAGRSDKKGEVIIETYNPNNYILQCVKENDYLKFYNYEMYNRHKLSYPPYTFITTIKVSSRNFKTAEEEIFRTKKFLLDNLEETTEIIGPALTNLAKINDIYYFQLIIKYKKDKNLISTLKELDKIFVLNKYCNLEIDNNPLSI